jgi:hypothetical protein
MKFYCNEKGIALVTALMLTLISLTFMMAVLYMLTQGTRTSASAKHYASAMEATYGGVDFFTKDALPQMLLNVPTAFSTSNITLSAASIIGTYPTLAVTMPNITNACMQAKLTSTPTNWTNAVGCTADNLSSDISQLRTTADMTFTFPGTTGSSAYRVYAKIIDTAIGNTDTSQWASGGLLTGVGVVRSGTAEGGSNTAATKIPYYFDIEVQGEAAANPLETTRVTLFYAY